MAELSRSAGVSERTIQRIERGERSPQMTTRRALARALGLPPGVIWPSGSLDLAERRVALGLSQVRLAVMADVSPWSVRNLERGSFVESATQTKVLAVLHLLEQQASSVQEAVG